MGQGLGEWRGLCRPANRSAACRSPKLGGPSRKGSGLLLLNGREEFGRQRRLGPMRGDRVCGSRRIHGYSSQASARDGA